MFKKLFPANRRAAAAEAALPACSTPENTGPSLIVRQQLQQLNLEFLRLLQAAQRHRGERWAKHLELSVEQGNVLRQCDHAQLLRIADCGFAVFSAVFADPGSWQRLHQLSQRIAPAERYTAMAPRTETLLQRFCINLCQSVLFFSWHLSRQEPHWARMLLGMPDGTMQIITSLDIWHCQFIAYQYCNVLQPRWLGSPTFWNDLLQYGLTGDAERERMLRSISRHLTASEVEPSAIMRLCGEEPAQLPVA